MTWKNSALFKGLSPQEISLVETYIRRKTYEPKTWILREGEKGSDIYFIESGKVEILKNDWISKTPYPIQILAAGELFGEMAMVGDNIRHASVRSLDLLTIDRLSFDALVKACPEIANKISKNLSVLLASRLSETDNTVVRGLRREVLQVKKRAAMSSLTVKVFAILALYQVMVRTALNYIVVSQLSLLISLFMVSISRVLYGLVKDYGYPLKMYGLTTRNWKRSVREAILFTTPFLLLILGIKYFFLKTRPEYVHTPLFQLGMGEIINKQGSINVISALSLIIYIAFSPAQEFIFRGVIQSSLQRFLHGPRRILYSILVTCLISQQFHFYFNMSLLVFLPDLFWCWLFLRHRTLIGVSLSHMLIGIWTFFIVGLRP